MLHLRVAGAFKGVSAMEPFVASLLQFFFLAAIIGWGLGTFCPFFSPKTVKKIAFIMADIVVFSGVLSLIACIASGIRMFVRLNAKEEFTAP